MGLQVLGPEAETDALVYVPSGYRPDAPVPLVLMLHGAGGMAGGALDPFLGLADGAGVMLVAPQSRDRTWDAILGQYGPDVARVDRALEQVMGRYAVDGARVAVEGFSDGASYALGIGLANGDLFSSVIAFSPGFEPPARRVGKPRVFVSHGVADPVLPIDRCSRRVVPHLRDGGYDVRYEEFDGGHEIPPAIVSAAWEWLPAGG